MIIEISFLGAGRWPVGPSQDDDGLVVASNRKRKFLVLVLREVEREDEARAIAKRDTLFMRELSETL